MSYRLLPAALVLLTGCAATAPTTLTRTVVERCPSTLPTESCPAWPPGEPGTLLDLEAGYAKGKAAHAACAATLAAWRAAFEGCEEGG